MADQLHHPPVTSVTPDWLRHRFASGASAEEFLASLPDTGARIAELESLVDVDPAGSPFARLDRDMNVLAIVEGWCRDSQDGTAVLLRLVRSGASRCTVRFFLRSENPDLMAAYRKDGRYDSIPVLLFLDAEGNEIGRYIERPDEVTAIYQRHRAELAERHPEFAPADAAPKSFPEPVRDRLRAEMLALRERDRRTTNGYIITALEALAGRVASPIGSAT